MNDNIVIFKGKRDGITIVLDKETDFESLQSALKTKTADARKFFGGNKTAISFRGRELNEDEEQALLSIVSEESGLNLSFVKTEPAKLPPKLLTNQPTPDLQNIIDNNGEGNTLFHRSGLRSGQSIRYNGSVVVLGDVNPGGEIYATGNIIVLGTLRGLVHAGSDGNADCFVAAIALLPIQLRIADIITYLPTSVTRKKATPSYAFVREGQIFIAPLMN